MSEAALAQPEQPGGAARVVPDAPAGSPSPALRALLIVLTLHAGLPTALDVTAVVFALVTGGFAVGVPETER
jgi:hypothetical protein